MIGSVFVGTSLDGFIARTDDRFDFLPQDGGEPHGYAEFIASVDALIVGRRTYDVVLGFGQWPYGQKQVVVLSSRELAPAPEGAVVEHMSGEPADIVKALRSRGIAHASRSRGSGSCSEGGTTAR